MKLGDSVRVKYCSSDIHYTVVDLDPFTVESDCGTRYVEDVDGYVLVHPQVDEVNHPAHYNKYPVECITLTEHMNFCCGNAVKYIYRAGDKGDAITDLKKSLWYIKREIARLEAK